MAIPTKDELYAAAKARTDKIFEAIHKEFVEMAEAAKTDEERWAVMLHGLSLSAMLAHRSREVLATQLEKLRDNVLSTPQ